MQQIFEKPKSFETTLLLIQTEDEDIISTSGGDTEKVNPFEW